MLQPRGELVMRRLATHHQSCCNPRVVGSEGASGWREGQREQRERDPVGLRRLCATSWWIVRNRSRVTSVAPQLERQGARLRVFHSLIDAMTDAVALDDGDSQNRPDAAIIDLVLDDGAAADLIEHLAHPRRFTPCLVLARQDLELHITKALHVGAYRVAYEPLEQHVLLDLCLSTLAWGKARREEITASLELRSSQRGVEATPLLGPGWGSIPEGWDRLSESERAVAVLVARGDYSAREIATMRHVSVNTIRKQRADAYAKPGVHSARELRRLLQRFGLLDG